MTASNLVGTTSTFLSSIWIASGPVFAYHGTADHTGAPVGAILPIVIVVVLGVILLSVWKPRSRKSKKREHAPGARAAHKRQKRGR